jgi:hypothetical protein
VSVLRLLRNLALGAVSGAIAVFLAARDGGPASAIHWDWTLWGAAAGALAGLLATLAPLLVRAPRDWPTIDEFRRGIRRRSREPDPPRTPQ